MLTFVFMLFSFTGNTARKLFQNYKTFSEITGVNEELIRRFYVLLSVLNGGYPNLHSNKFAIYAWDTAKLFVDTYPWFYMLVSVHKMLMHGDAVRVIDDQ